jgi:2-polyprenyl-6-methoxyphenol hydroxylase-like FAD-dependent oxidoreductase
LAQHGNNVNKINYGGINKVTAHFANASSRNGTLLVGADGPRSQTRECLFGQSKTLATALPILYANVAFSYNDAEKAKFVRSVNPVCSFAVHPECVVMISIQDVPNPNDTRSWRFQLVISWIGTRDNRLSNEEKHAAVKKRAASLPEVTLLSPGYVR